MYLILVTLCILDHLKHTSLIIFITYVNINLLTNMQGHTP